MPTTWIIVVLLGGLMALGVWERSRRDAARAAIPVRVHVNGTRGKSTVTRLIAGGLRAGGIRTVAKTTGTAPRLILPDGGERPVRRRAPASIGEQLWLMREARRLGAGALVVECMAIDPDLQEVSERDMIGATLGVVTNARADHGEAMGRSPAEVASALSRALPRHAVVVLGTDPGQWREVIGEEAARRGTRVVAACLEDQALDALSLPRWLRQDYAVALTATRHLGVPDQIALAGMAAAVPDPGASRTAGVWVQDRPVDVIDATAANDPESLRHLVGRMTDTALVVFNHRADRPLRLWQFAEAGVWADPGLTLLITGDRPDWWSARRARRALDRPQLPFVRRADLVPHLRAVAANLPALRTIVLSGNSKQIEPARIVAGLGG